MCAITLLCWHNHRSLVWRAEAHPPTINRTVTGYAHENTIEVRRAASAASALADDHDPTQQGPVPTVQVTVDKIFNGSGYDARMKSIQVFFDEGALDGKYRLPSACAVVIGDAEAADSQIENLVHELSLQPGFRLENGADSFSENGFHHVDDNFATREKFKQLLPRIDFEWWCSSSFEAGTTDPYESLPDQFIWVTTGILQKYKKNNIHIVFEQNDRLTKHFSRIVDSAMELAGRKKGAVEYSIGTKRDRVLSIADYCISITSQAVHIWMNVCCDTKALKAKHEYRSFADIEPSCSTLFAATYQRSISRRAQRMGDHSFYEISGIHSPGCKQPVG